MRSSATFGDEAFLATSQAGKVVAGPSSVERHWIASRTVVGHHLGSMAKEPLDLLCSAHTSLMGARAET